MGTLFLMASDKVHLRKDINLLSASAIMTGVIIGSGIFVSPVSFMKNCGSVAMSLIMWVLSGVLSLMVALCFSELGGIYPKSGGEYTFFREILGPLPAFVDAWHQLVMVQPSFQALLALTTVDYLVQAIFPESCGVPPVAARMMAVWIIVTMVMLNSVYVRYVTRVQTFLTTVKVIALLSIVVTGIVQLAFGRVENLRRGFENTNPDAGGHAVAVHSGVFTYMGWQYLFCLMEEVKHPNKIVPRATILSITTVTILYTLTNVAYFTVLTPEEMISSKAVALLFAEKTWGRASLLIPFFVACSTVGSLNGAILGGSRYYFAAARDDLFPSVMSTIHVQYLTPWPSLFSVTILTIIYVITGEAITLLEYLGFAATAMLFVAVSSLLYLRWRKPFIERPIKIPLIIPVFCSVVLAGLLILGVYQSPYQNGIACVLVATGIPVYYLVVRWASKRKVWRRHMQKATCVIQKCLLVVPTEKTD